MTGCLATLPANMAWLLTRVQFSVTLTFLSALAAAFLLRRAAAALRHRVWAMSVLAAVLLPTLIALLPEGRVVAIGLRPAPDAADEARPTEPAAPANVAHRDDRVLGGGPPSNVPAAFAANPSMPAAATPPPSETTRTIAAPAASERPTSPQSFGTPRPPDRLAPVLIGLWLAAALLLIARQAFGIVKRNQLLRYATDIQSSRAGAALAALCRRHGIAARPRLVVTPRADSPLCVGSIVPCIVLPSDWPTWPAGQLQAVLTHELSHVVRRDVLWQQLARLACAIHWPNPLAWVAAWRMRVERELACDDFVLRGGEPATCYVRWLIAFAETLGRRSPRHQTVGVAMAAGNRFEQRVRSILDPRRPRNGVSMRAGVAMALAALALLGVAGIVSPLGPLSARRAAADSSPAAGPTTLPATEPTSAKTVLLAGLVVDEAGQPVAGPLVTLTLGAESQPVVGDARGRFSFRVEPKQLRYFSLVARTTDGLRQAFFDRENAGDEPPAGLVMTLKPAREFAVTVKDKNGAAVAGAWVAGEGLSLLAEAITDGTGHAALRVPRDGGLESITVDKPGIGIDYVVFFRKNDVHSDPYRLASDYSGPVSLTLHDTIPVSVRVFDDKNQPLRGVRVYPWVLQMPKKAGDINVEWPHFARFTDDNGTANFDVPADVQQSVVFWTRLKGYAASKRCVFDPKAGKRDLMATLATLAPVVHVTGHVVDRQGKGAANVRVDTYGAGFRTDSFRDDTRTDDSGNFAIDVDPELFYIFVASAEGRTSAASYAIVRSESPAKPIELSLKQSTRVFGTAVHGPNNEPLRGETIVLEQDDNAYYQLPPEQQFPQGVGGNAILPTVQSAVKTDAQGRFEFRTGPGKYLLRWRTSDWMLYPAGRFTVKDEPEMEVRFLLAQEPKPAGPELLTGRVVLRGTPGAGASEAKLTAYSFGGNDRPFATTNSDGSFVIRRGSGELYIGAASADDKLRGIVRIGAKDAIVTIPIGPSASADGRLIDPDGKPLPGRTITYGIKVVEEGGAWDLRFGGSIKTNDMGLFHLDGLVPGYPYTLNVVVEETPDGNPRRWMPAGSVQADKAETVHAGDLKLPAEPHEKTASDYAKEAFTAKGTIGEQYDAARRRARLTTTNLLILVGRPDLPNCRRFYEFSNTMDTSAVREQLLGYVKLAVDVRSPADARRLIEGLGVQWPAEGELAVAVVDPDDKLLAQAGEKDLCVNGVLDSGRLTAFTKAHVPDLPDAWEILAGALAKAKREDKRVILDESAPWCTWCVKLAEYVQANRAAFDTDFVFLTIDRRFKNGDAVLDQFRKEPGSIPWMVILDADGKPLITSDAPGIGNAGYPDDEASLAHWEKMLHTGAKRLSSAEIHALARKAVEK